MSELEKLILKMIYLGKYIDNDLCESIKFCDNATFKVKLSIKMDVNFCYIKLDSKSENEIAISLPSDEEISQLVKNLSEKEVKQYTELESMLTKTQLKSAVGLAFIH